MLLIGLRRRNHLGLLATLSHQLDRLLRLESFPPDHWIVAGPLLNPLPQPCQLEAWNLCFTVVVAPPDDHPSARDIVGYLDRFDAIGVEWDAPRVNTGLSDLHGAPYAAELARLRDRVFYTCGDGGLFRDRLDHLLSQVVPLADNSPAGNRPWFVHEIESYDGRYTEFIRLVQEVCNRCGTDRELVRLWRAERLSTAPPFTSAALKDAFNRAWVSMKEER